MRKVISFLKPYRWPMAIAWLLMLIELGVELWQPIFMAKIIDDGIAHENLSIVVKWGSVMIGFSFLAFAAGIINSFFSAHVSQNFGYDLRTSLFKKVQDFSFANLARFPTSSLITRMTNDVNQVQNTVFMSLRIMLRAPLMILGAGLMALFVNFKLALVLVVLVPIMVVFMFWMMKKGGTLFSKVQQRLDRVNNVIQENLIGIKLIKAFTRRKHEGERFLKANQELRDRTITVLRIIEATMPILLFVMNMGIIGVLWFGNINITNGNVQVGEVVAIINYGTRMTAALSMLTFITMAFSRAKASADRISEVLTTEVDLLDPKEIESSQNAREGEISFKNVSFNYPGEQTPVLSNISFTIKHGQTVAVLGATGSGKSSLFQLIPRLYDVTEGEITLDGIDIRKLKLDHLRKQIGFVPQEAILFTGTVKENIGWGKEDASMEDIIEAAKSAQIHDTIVNLPDQYETRIGQRGVNLSGGQKQRLSIARALIRKPKFLFLDDSTSALDLKTEAKLLKAIKKYNCNTYIITQKISTAMAADTILLLEDGELLAQGSHDELLVQSKLYQQIYESQFGEGMLTYVQKA